MGTGTTASKGTMEIINYVFFSEFGCRVAKGRPCLVVVVPAVPAKGLVGFELERIQRSFNCFAFGDEGMIVLEIIPIIYV